MTVDFDPNQRGTDTLNHSAEHLNGNLKGKDILSVRQFDVQTLDHVFRMSGHMEEIVSKRFKGDYLSRYILANLFYEPSTRTSSSFTAAMERLGGSVIPINEVKYSSVEKGENLEDTVRTLEQYADVIVLRHHETGSAAIAAEACSKPIINAGDGVGEHPTQALLDYVTVRKEQGRIDGLTVTMLGDMKHGRTVHSLARLLSLYPGVNLNYVSPEILRMPPEIIEELKATGVGQSEHEDLSEVLKETDVLYVTRVQEERFGKDPELKKLYESLKLRYVITPDTVKAGKESLTVMHPLPRVGEITMEVDALTKNAAYFRQMENGLFVRMVLLAGVLGKLPS